LNVSAGIITNTPDIDRLAKNIEAILPQVSKLLIVDNASTNIDQLQKTFSDKKIDWILNNTNKGVSGALNQLIEHAEKLDYEWIITLDDDSVCSDNMVAELLTATSHYDSIAVVSPRTLDRDVPEINTKHNEPRPDTEEIDMCITAGSLTNIKAINVTGGFNERLFIDHVDHDMCLRLRRKGYKIIKVNTAVIYQEFGKETVRRKFLWKTYTQRGYSPLRVYYQTRNFIYMLRKYGKEFRARPSYYYIQLIFAFFARFLYEPRRISRLKAFVRGYSAGLFMELEKK